MPATAAATFPTSRIGEVARVSIRIAAGDRVDLRAEAAKRGDEPAARRPEQQHRAGEQGGEPAGERDEQAAIAVEREQRRD